MKKSIKISFVILATTLMFFSLDSIFKTEVAHSQSNTLPTKAPTLKLNDPLPQNLFIELAKAINPSVVNISTTTMPKRPRYRDPLFDMLEQFYGYQMRPQQIRPAQSLGTGFIIREDGLIVTNNHVIAGADVIKVQLSEDSKKLYEAKVVGRDDRTDIALIKIKPDVKLSPATLGSSKDVEVGEWVAAFGNPFGHGHTMTKGIISAKGRELGEINRFPFLQTDASINPGNSGGPLVNAKGLVIGVNTAIDARAQGIGFAIPIDEVKSIIPELETIGKIKKGYIGVGLATLNPMAAEQLGLKDTDGGAVITMVEKSGPGAKAGLQPYDIITEFNGKKIQNENDLVDAVVDAKIGSQVSAKVYRNNKEINLVITVSERPEDRRSNPFARKKQEEPQKVDGTVAPFNIGLTLADLNKDLRKEFKIEDESIKKPIILEVQTGSAAQQAGLQPGDVILDINRKEVFSATEAMKAFKKGTNTVRIVRGDFVTILVLSAE